MIKRFLLLFLLAPAAFAQCLGHSYTTTFPATENPISQGSCWFNGAADGTNWGNVKTVGGTPGQAHGTVINGGPPFNDSIAALKGTWGPNQYARAVVAVNATNSTGQEEVELHLNRTIVAGNSTGYEFDYNVKNGANYVVIVRWDGPIGGFHYCINGGACTATSPPTVPALSAVNGSVIEAYSIAGHLYLLLNGAIVYTATDNTYTGGSPGMGFWQVGGTTANLLDIGLKSFTASDSQYIAATPNTADVAAVITGPIHTVVNGDTIVMPTGIGTLTAPIVWPSGVGFSLLGSGQVAVGVAARTCPASPAGTCIVAAPTSSTASVFNGTLTVGESLVRISNFTIVPASPYTSTKAPVILGGICSNTTPFCPSVRIDHLTVPSSWGLIVGLSDCSFNVLQNVYGVVDHNTVGDSGAIPCNNGLNFVNVGHGNWHGLGFFGDQSWASPDSFGTAEAIFLEDNTFSSAFGTDMDNPSNNHFGGGRAVCRFNTFNTISGASACTNHGTDTTGPTRGGRQIEFYGNLGSCPAQCNTFVGDRSGSSLVFANQLTGAGAHTVHAVATQRRYRPDNPWNGCDGTQQWDTNDTNGGGGNVGFVYYTGTVGTVSNYTIAGNGGSVTDSGNPGWTANQWAPPGAPYEFYDVTKAGAQTEILTNTSNSTSYNFNNFFAAPATGDTYRILRPLVCLDQPARGAGALVGRTDTIGGFGPFLVSTGFPGPVTEAPDPIYEWADIGTYQGMVSSQSPSLLINRDYYANVPGQTAQTSSSSPFNGTATSTCGGSALCGTGYGTLANRPSTCTTGVGYYATDQGNWNTASKNFPGQTFSQGQLFLCTATNTWTLSYTPYPYPHPLVSGTPGPPPVPSISPSSENFGSVSIGSSSPTQTATVTNPTTSAVTVTSVTTGAPGTNGADFPNTANTCSGTVPANGGSCQVTKQFTPSLVGAESATLTVNLSSGPLTVSLSGTGISSGAPATSYNPSPMLFGNVVVNQTKQVVLTITNTGNATLTISANALGDTTVWTKNTGTCSPSGTVAPLGICTITVSFTPTAAVNKTTTLTVTSNAPTNPDVINLSGSGILVPTTATGVTIQGAVIQ